MNIHAFDTQWLFATVKKLAMSCYTAYLLTNQIVIKQVRISCHIIIEEQRNKEFVLFSLKA